MKKSLIPLGCLATLLSACNLAPTYERPSVPIEAQAFKESQDWQYAKPSDSTPKGQWWEAFNDPTLNQLEAKIEPANQNIQAALARLDEARAIVRASNASYFPTLSASVSSSKNQYSMGRPYFSQSTNQQFEDNLAGFSVHYEPDVWGKIHNAVSASKAQALATESDLATLSLSIHAELAADYFNLRCADQTQQYLDDMVFTSTKTRNLIQQLFHGGLAPATDVAQAELQRQNAITAAIDNKIKRGQIEHAIATLTGQNPANFVLKAELDVIPLIPTFEIGLPSNLLERRPDVASAERRLMAANASVGIAKSAFFPSFGLNAAAGYESSSLANWFKAPNLFWSVGPSAALTIFDGGLRTAQVDQAKSVVVEATADYRQTVLDALKETEDNLIALKGLEREHDSASSALDATKTTLAMAEARYKGGIASDLDVTQAQMIDLQSHIVLTTIEARRQVATVLLVKALGGGWSSAPQ